MSALSRARSLPRVLIANSTLHIGGAERVVANLARHLDRSKFDVLACYLKENGVVGEEMRSAGVNLLPIPGMRRDGRPDYLTSLKLLKLIRQHDIRLIHTHDTHSFIDGAICKVLRPRLKYVHTFHWGNYPVLPRSEERLERLLWRVPDALVCVGHQQAGAVRKLYGIPARRIEVIWNGTEAPVPEIAPEVSAVLPGDGTPVLCSISTLIPQKGIADLLRAAAMMRDAGKRFLLLIVGDGKLRSELQAMSMDLGLGESVKFLGWIEDASRRVLPACDLFVQSSHWEAMSVVILEAMAAAKPIVATTVGENTHVLSHDASGLLVAPGDHGALANAILGLLEEPARRARLGNAARERFRQAFTIPHMISNHERLYARLLGRDAGEPR